MKRRAWVSLRSAQDDAGRVKAEQRTTVWLSPEVEDQSVAVHAGLDVAVDPLERVVAEQRVSPGHVEHPVHRADGQLDSVRLVPRVPSQVELGDRLASLAFRLGVLDSTSALT